MSKLTKQELGTILLREDLRLHCYNPNQKIYPRKKNESQPLKI